MIYGRLSVNVVLLVSPRSDRVSSPSSTRMPRSKHLKHPHKSTTLLPNVVVEHVMHIHLPFFYHHFQQAFVPSDRKHECDSCPCDPSVLSMKNASRVVTRVIDRIVFHSTCHGVGRRPLVIQQSPRFFFRIRSLVYFEEGASVLRLAGDTQNEVYSTRGDRCLDGVKLSRAMGGC
jgi:hypothetical protein